MNWILGIFAFLRSLPEILRLLLEVRKVVRDLGESKTRKERAKMLHEALREARKTGDFTKIEELFNTEKQ